jgi:LPS export ABC transporter protein LptC
MQYAAAYKMFFTALILGCFVFCGCENDEKSIPNFSDKRLMLEEGKNIEAYMSQDAKVKGKLTAPIMYRYLADSPYFEFPKTLHVDFYNDSLKKESQVDALYGKYKENERLIFLRDSVVVMNMAKGDTLKCEELWWDQNKQEIFTNKPTRIYQKDRTIYSRNGLRAAQNLSWWVTYDNIGTTLLPNDSLP